MPLVVLLSCILDLKVQETYQINLRSCYLDIVNSLFVITEVIHKTKKIPKILFLYN